MSDLRLLSFFSYVLSYDLFQKFNNFGKKLQIYENFSK